jgi:hypothetical protein
MPEPNPARDQISVRQDLFWKPARAAFASASFRRHILGQSEPFDLTANECEERAINRLANYEMLSVEEKLDALKDARELLCMANARRWRESEGVV